MTETHNLWGVGPAAFRAGEHRNLHYDHEQPRLHRIVIERIGGIGEPNAGEFLVTTPCGYKGWVRAVNKNPEAAPPCEACLNGAPSSWVRYPIPSTAVRAEQPRPEFEGWGGPW